MFAIMSLTDPRNLNMPSYGIPILVGLTLGGLIVSYGLNCGAALNPARDLSARIFLATAGYGGQAFRYKKIFYRSKQIYFEFILI